jgi:hypothetical protein
LWRILSQVYLCLSFDLFTNGDYSNVVLKCISSISMHVLLYLLAAENPHIQDVATSAVVPPPTVLDRVLKDLFHEGVQSIPLLFLFLIRKKSVDQKLHKIFKF